MYAKAQLLLMLTLFTAFRAVANDAIHERIEWSDVWVVNANVDDKPRVLLVGDSIVKGYYRGVEETLGERANCARFATSKFLAHPDYLKELGLLVDRFAFDVIHVNNGLHGWAYPEAQYREGLIALFGWLRDHAPDATIIWTQSTPVRESDDLSSFNVEKNDRVVSRNAIAAKLAKEADIVVNDLYALMKDHPAYYASDGVHFNDEGRAVQASHVASIIEQHLPEVRKQPAAVE